REGATGCRERERGAEEKCRELLFHRNSVDECVSILHAKISVELVHVGLELRIGKTVDHLAVLDDVVAVRHGGREAEVLLDQKDSETLLLQPRNGVTDLLDN